MTDWEARIFDAGVAAGYAEAVKAVGPGYYEQMLPYPEEGPPVPRPRRRPSGIDEQMLPYGEEVAPPPPLPVRGGPPGGGRGIQEYAPGPGGVPVRIGPWVPGGGRRFRPRRGVPLMPGYGPSGGRPRWGGEDAPPMPGYPPPGQGYRPKY